MQHYKRANCILLRLKVFLSLGSASYEKQYNLPHPLEFIENPPSKLDFKKKIKSAIINYWENKLRGEASFLQSLEWFKPNFMSLIKPHPIWTTAEVIHTKYRKLGSKLGFFPVDIGQKVWQSTGARIQMDTAF